jgi:hypothetical protein
VSRLCAWAGISWHWAGTGLILDLQRGQQHGRRRDGACEAAANSGASGPGHDPHAAAHSFVRASCHASRRRSEQERFRRRDLLHVLRNRREQIQQSLKRQQQQSERDALMAGAGGSGGGAARETEATAALDTRGLLQLQEQVMKQQDRELEQMEKTVTSTKVFGAWVGVGGGENEGAKHEGHWTEAWELRG